MFGRSGDLPAEWATARRVGLSVAGALPALLVRGGVHHLLSAWTVTVDARGRQVQHAGVYVTCCTGLAVGMLVGLCRWAPRVWRRVRTATGRRVLAFGCVGLAAAAIGLPFPGEVAHAPGTLFGLAAAVGGFRLWDVWRRRWQGVGENPNVLTGLVRPPVRPGQLWWAAAASTEDPDQGRRAVLVLGRHPGGCWDVAPVTFQEQGARLPGQLPVSPQRIRQFASAGRLNVTERSLLGRAQLRSYVGRAPDPFYRKACAHAGRLPGPFPSTRDRISAGGDPGTGTGTMTDTGSDRPMGGSAPWWTVPGPESTHDGPGTGETVVLPYGG